MQNTAYTESKNKLVSLKNSLTAYQTRLDVLKEERRILLNEKKKHEDVLDKIPLALTLLQALYEKSSGDLIRSCESVMTDAVQAVIDDDSRIGIDAEVSGKQIKVTVGTVQDLEDGGRVLRDIMTHEGGGLTNVVTTSLRAISIVRSGQRRFMVLDEPNCWLNPAQIPVFSAIIKDMALRAGFQIILLTHHGVQQFEDIPDINIIRMDYDGSSIRMHSSHSADTTTPGIISSIDLHNFGGHENLHLPLTAGLNVVTGPSNIGKSRIIAALRAVIYGTGSQADIRTTKDDTTNRVHMEKSASVKITFDQGKVIEWTRKKSGSPIESWKLKLPGLPDNEVPIVNGNACSGRNGTQWVGLPDVLNIRTIGGTTPALHFQKTVFALEDSKAMAALISVSKTSVHLNNMILVTNEKKKVSTSEIRHIDSKLENISQFIFLLDTNIPRLKAVIDDAVRIQDNITQRTITTERMQDLLNEHMRLTKLLSISKRMAATYIEPKRLPDINGMIDLILKMDRLQIDLWYAKSLAQTHIEHSPIDIRRIQDMVALIKRYRKLKNEFSYHSRMAATYIEPKTLPDINGMIDLITRHDALSIELWYHASMRETFIKSSGPDIKRVQDMSALAKKYIGLQRQKEIAVKISRSGVPQNTKISEAVSRIEGARALLSNYKKQVTKLEEQKAENKKTHQELEENTQELRRLRGLLGVCPICGATT